MQRLIISLGVLTGCFAATAQAIPPPPPAQSGSIVSSFDCPAETVTITERWNYRESRTHRYSVAIGGKPLSRADADKLDAAIQERGRFQAASVYCGAAGRIYQLALHSYWPTTEHLRIFFSGQSIKSIGQEPSL